MTTTTTTTTPANVATVVSIGRRTIGLERTVGETAAAIVAATPASYDWSKRGAIPAMIHLWATGTDDKSARPAQMTPAKTPTPYGVGVNSLSHAIKTLVAEDATPEVAMRVSLTGVGSAVVPTDHPAYALLLALLGAESPAE